MKQRNLIDEIFCPNRITDAKEKILNLDFKILSWNRNMFRQELFDLFNIKDRKRISIDIKSPLDPEVIAARNEPRQTLEDIVENLLKSISKQRQRAIDNIMLLLY